VDPGGGAKLFLGDTVLTKDASGAVTGVRTYAQDGASPVERTTTTGVTGSSLVWLFSDVDGTVDTQTVATSGATTSQYRDPFGNGIGAGTGVWGDGNGFLNKPASTSTGLTSLGDRFYDATLGRFESVDPVLAVGNPQQVNGYSYAGNDPITNTDPSGDCYEADTGALTHNVNCALGHGVTAASASTVASMYAKVNGTGNTTAWLRSYNRASYLHSLARSTSGSAHGSWDNYGGAYGKPSPQAAAISAGVGLTVVSVGLAFIPIADGADTVTIPAAGAEFTSAAEMSADVDSSLDTLIYRGLSNDHHVYGEALEGEAWPGDVLGSDDAVIHNSGATEMTRLTSWSTDRSVAVRFATKGGRTSGVILKTRLAEWADRVVVSPDSFDESEVLIRGVMRGLDVEGVH